jgi:uncharacterized Zn finger protein
MARMAIALGFTEETLEDAAGTLSFDRGRHYLDAVDDFEATATEITATVYGTSPYHVSLTARNRQLAGNCSCPYGQEGAFCKHCVAVGLTAVKDGVARLIDAGPAGGPPDGTTTLESWLASLSKDDLLAELLELLDDDPELRRRFELRAGSRAADETAVRKAVRELIEIGDAYVEYGDAHDYARDVGRAADAIEGLIDVGGAAHAIGVARDAIGWFLESYESVDDSSGSVGGAGYGLFGAHLRACQSAPPDPRELSQYLADLLLGDQHGFEFGLGDYHDLLGDEGHAMIRRRIAEEYARNPDNWQARTLMESVVRAEGDTDTVIDVYAASLDDRGWAHLRIARELDRAGRDAEALGWGERGLEEATCPATELVEYVAARYAAAGRPADVLALRRARFLASPALDSYQALRQAATACGAWPSEREAALTALRDDARSSSSISGAQNGSALFDVLLDEGDLDAAWAAVEQAVVTAPGQLIRLADASAAARPAGALRVYLDAVATLTTQTGNEAYLQIARLLLSARDCHERLGTSSEFEGHLAELRTSQRRKRALLRILDYNGL